MWKAKKHLYEFDKPEVITEMCDVCGKSVPAPINRKSFPYKESITVVIRYCQFCDPVKYFQKTFKE